MTEYLATIFPGRVRKIAVNAALGCPNRDGTLGLEGCVYCNNAAFNPAYAALSPHAGISAQLQRGISFSSRKGSCYGYLAYFQSYTGTYGPTARLTELYEEALAFPGVKGLVIATRPDCIAPDLMDWMERRFGRLAPHGHPHLLVEIGVESTLDSTLKAINRHHTFGCASQCIEELARRGIDTGVHLILGLPSETPHDYVLHARRISQLPVRTVKLHQLQIVRDTPLARRYAQDPQSIRLFSAAEYARVVADFILAARSDLYYDRFVSETPSELLVAPRWGLKPQVFTALVDQLL